MKHQQFIEKLGFHVFGGKGGLGNVKFGVSGGRGGDVYIEATNKYSLDETRLKVLAEKPKGGPGAHATPSNLLPRNGVDKVIRVPINSVVYTSDHKFLGKFEKDCERLLVAKGGLGGCKLNNYKPERGTLQRILLQLKILADVGFVGFPNAGKSTLLTTMSKATPVIAPYAFTTLKPQIGHLYYEDYRTLSMADLPGLIEGAWNNQGLGHEFLRHVERTKMLLYVIDINGFKLSEDDPYRSAFECIMLLNKELEIYDSSLLMKPAVIAINKMDQPGSIEKFKELFAMMKNRKELYLKYPKDERPTIVSKFNQMVPVAAKYRTGVDGLADTIRQNIDRLHSKAQGAQLKSARRKLERIGAVRENIIKNF